MRSVMTHVFSEVPSAQIPRSSFDRSHGYKTTFNAGYLIPVFVDEVLPGDTLSLRMTSFARLSTPLVPIMDNLFCDSHFFFVPNRLVWNNWEKFNGEQDNPGDSTDYEVPLTPAPAATGWTIGSLGDYFGIPTEWTGFSVNALPFRAYNLIYNEWFRDQNMQNSKVVDKDDGPDTATDYVLLQRGKRHDYFTSCLPWPQKGDAVELPLGTTAPVTTTSVAPKWTGTGLTEANMSWDSTNDTWHRVGGNPGNTTPVLFGTVTGLQADLSAATAATINQLREAFQIQKLYERDARGGTRYTEIIRAHFGVISPDARLQRPEYLGGGSTPVSVKAVPQTSATGATGTPQGHLTATGIIAQSGQGFTKSFTEHGYVIGLVSVRADLNYQQGLNRLWTRNTRWDFYWPALAHIGEQAVLRKEIYFTANPSSDDTVFGYQERYAEYRYKPSQITGKFRSTATGTLDMWHLAQKFTAAPTLGDTFIKETPPMSRIKAVTTEPDFYFDAYFQYKCARPMPVYGVPGNIDRF